MPTILLIEDDPAVRQVIEQHLTEAGFVVVARHDTQTALKDMSRLQEIDLLLTDLVMPGGQPDGLDFATTAKAQSPDLPIIFITGYYGFVARAGELPGRVLYKPVDLHVLTGEINTLLSG